MTLPVLALAAAPLVIGLLALLVMQPMRITLPVYAAALPFGGLLSIGSTRFGSLSSILGMVLGLGLVLQLATARRTVRRLSPTVPLWLLFTGMAGATVLWSLTPDKTINGFLSLSSLAGVYILVALRPVDRLVVNRVENGVLFGGVTVICYGLVQLTVLGGFPSDVPGVGPVSDGRFGNDMIGPNNQAVALLLPLVIALTRSTSRPTRTSRVLHLALAALLVLGILMTASRGGMLATILVVLVLAIANPQGRSTLVGYSVVGAIFMAIVFLVQPGGITSREVETTSSSGRTSIWRVALAACPEYCPVGSGWGTFPDVYAETQASVPDAEVLVGKGGSYEPHNVWILVAIELGVPGVILLAGALGFSFLEAMRLPARLRGPPLSALTGTVFAALFLSNLEFKFFWLALIMVALSRNMALGEAADARRQTVPAST